MLFASRLQTSPCIQLHSLTDRSAACRRRKRRRRRRRRLYFLDKIRKREGKKKWRHLPYNRQPNPKPPYPPERNLARGEKSFGARSREEQRREKIVPFPPPYPPLTASLFVSQQRCQKIPHHIHTKQSHGDHTRRKWRHDWQLAERKAHTPLTHL